MARIICPHCRSPRFGKSRTRNLKEIFLKAAGNNPYRCAECAWRGYVRNRRELAKSVFEFILFAVFIMWIAFAAYISVEDFLQDYRSGINKKVMAEPKSRPPQALDGMVLPDRTRS